VLAEIGLVIGVGLGTALGINAILLALHIPAP
jgi:hypothetical protein